MKKLKGVKAGAGMGDWKDASPMYKKLMKDRLSTAKVSGKVGSKKKK
jgi:hypothetical protein